MVLWDVTQASIFRVDELSTLKGKAASSYETLISVKQIMWHIPEDHNLSIYCHENLHSLIQENATSFMNGICL
jgi:hypothetical protein